MRPDKKREISKLLIVEHQQTHMPAYRQKIPKNLTSRSPRHVSCYWFLALWQTYLLQLAKHRCICRKRIDAGSFGQKIIVALDLRVLTPIYRLSKQHSASSSPSRRFSWSAQRYIGDIRLKTFTLGLNCAVLCSFYLLSNRAVVLARFIIIIW